MSVRVLDTRLAKPTLQAQAIATQSQLVSTMSQPAAVADPVTPSVPRTRRRWAQRLGAAAFLFFLIKGLAWLAVPPLLIVAARFMGE